ncbi:uncharacterized protein LOC129976438 [Argiope bruennichi]|uniref:Uncharacterized protein n=1 Tax=Argiope bruennichi TaxID=94029 RepID=A0A8T0EPM4_ARGBR|nr:uncharacterized protein LOC129976438 [Argiope bruennichi]KAF8777852.1 hypothetical protein HNY73_014647 [Argiope bruennichi]
MMDSISGSWSEILEEMLPRNECDICIPPLDIGPPPPLPANFQDKAILSGSCNVCSVLSEVEMRPIQVTDASLLPVAATFVVGILFVFVTVIVLLLKIKKCQAFMPQAVCWIFPRNVLPHTELAPSSLPSPSPSMEKLKDSGKRQWHMSSRSLQSENIYEVCSPPSPDSLYEEVGPGPRSECSPYGVVMVENSFNSNMNKSRPSYGSDLAQDCLAGSRFQPHLMRNINLPNSRFSTFGGSAHGFVNPVVQDAHVTSSQTLRSSFRPRNSPGPGGYVQKRELPPVPGDNY